MLLYLLPDGTAVSSFNRLLLLLRTAGEAVVAQF